MKVITFPYKLNQACIHTPQVFDQGNKAQSTRSSKFNFSNTHFLLDPVKLEKRSLKRAFQAQLGSNVNYPKYPRLLHPRNGHRYVKIEN